MLHYSRNGNISISGNGHWSAICCVDGESLDAIHYDRLQVGDVRDP